MVDFDDAFRRHSRVAFQFSGGRDSTAALYLMRPYWARMTVYHVDSEDQFPETRAVVDHVLADLAVAGAPTPQILTTNVEAIRQRFGFPSDLVPVDNTDFGRRVSGCETRIISRYDCCWLALMQPMHKRMIEDGVTLIVRGQRDDEYAKPPLRSGDRDGGFEVLYPIQEWTGDMVSDYLRANDLPVAPYYERGMRRAPECMGCTAWWDEDRAKYLREYHPVAFSRYKGRMAAVKAEVDRQYQFMQREMEGF